MARKGLAASGNTLRSRITGNENVAPSELLPHPMNFRRHPKNQMGALRGSMAELGWLKGVLVNKVTGQHAQ